LEREWKLSGISTKSSLTQDNTAYSNLTFLRASICIQQTISDQQSLTRKVMWANFYHPFHSFIREKYWSRENGRAQSK